MSSNLFICMQGKYGNLDASVISYGPCQTPTLAFCVQRHQIMTAFQPEDFWSVRPHISRAGQRCDDELCILNLSWLSPEVDARSCHVFCCQNFGWCKAP